MSSGIPSEEYGTLGEDDRLQTLKRLARHPNHPRDLKYEIISILERTKWPFESDEVAQDLLNHVRRIPSQLDLEYHNPDPQTAKQAIEDLFKKVMHSSLNYGLKNSGARGVYSDGDATGCTEALKACREALRSLIPVLRKNVIFDGLGGWTGMSRARRQTHPHPAWLGGVYWISPTPFKVNGHFCDVFEGMHLIVGRVALKRPRTGATGYNEDAIRRFQREAETWGRLQHPHILEYLGSFQRAGHYYFMSPFIENGTLVEYITIHLGANRVKLLCETADALSYLHRENVVHGDIKASNLLIGDNGQVLLCDFGLTRTTDLRTSTAMKGAGTLRWQSPELWDGSSKCFKSDVYAFGMTIAEVLTGDVPFPELQTDGAVIRAVLIEGKRPPKNPAMSSDGLSYENVWTVAEACWPAGPDERISMSDALQLIQKDPALAAIQEF